MTIFENFARIKIAFVLCRVNPEQKCWNHFTCLFVSAWRFGFDSWALIQSVYSSTSLMLCSNISLHSYIAIFKMWLGLREH